MGELKPYPEYKDSEVPSLGNIPSHWQMIRSGYLFREIIDTGHPDLELLSIDRFRGIIRQRDIGRKERASKDRSLYKRIQKGQLGYNLMNAFMGSIGISQYEGIISPAYAVGQPKKEMIADYYHHLYRTQIYAAEINRYSYGIMYERNRLYYDYFKRIPVPYPPIDEQEKIVAVIHQKSREFQNLISVKRRLIELLNERKLEIISRAMTRGLDSNVRLKPSGSEWLGDVPQHWEIKPLKRWVNINERTLQENTDPNYSFYYIDIGSVGTGYLINQPEKMLFSNAPSRARRMLKCGDTIISTVRTYLKAIYFISAKIENHIASTGFAVLAPKSEVNPEYLSYLIQSNFFIDHVTANSKGVAYPAITESEMGTFYVPIPPDINEQKEILNSIKKSITPIDEIINKIRDEIEFILEYRTRLISDIITGKVDIRYEKITTIPVTSPNESDIVRPDDDLFSSEEDD